MAARLLATAASRSLWQCALKTARSAFGTRDDVREELAHFVRREVADRVGQVDGRAAGVDHRLDHPAEKIAVGASCVLGGKLHIVGMSPRQLDAVHRRGQAFVTGHAQLGREVQIRRRQKRANA